MLDPSFVRLTVGGLVFFAADVVEIVGSPGLKESLEAHLGDVLNDIPADKSHANAPTKAACTQVDRDAKEANGMMVDEKVASGVDASEDSQDSILDIDGVVHEDEDEVSLMEWMIADDCRGPGGNAPTERPVSFEVPMQHEGKNGSTTVQAGNAGTWRRLVHRDDPFLSLVPCEVARVALALQDHQHNHLETYRHLGLRLSGTHSYIGRWRHVTDRPDSPSYTKPPYDADALVSWFESGVGHRVWRTVRREHPDVLGPTLLPRRQENMPKAATGRKPARLIESTVHGHIKGSKARQRQAAKEKALNDSAWYV